MFSRHGTAEPRHADAAICGADRNRGGDRRPGSDFWPRRRRAVTGARDQHAQPENGTYVSYSFTGQLSGENQVSIVIPGIGATLSGAFYFKDVFQSNGGYFSDRRMRLTVRGGPYDGRVLEFKYRPGF
jgi:hypothetical protein